MTKTELEALFTAILIFLEKDDYESIRRVVKVVLKDMENEKEK